MKKNRINYVNLSKQWSKESPRLLNIIKKILSSGEYVNGKQIPIFEKNIAKICNTKYAVALNSGTDALVCALIALGIRKGDEVITPPNSFISSTSSIVHIGAIPVFVDVLSDQNIDPIKIERAITSKTKAIMPVHLTGRICDMDKIKKISLKYKIPIIEDAAQSIGSKLNGIPAGKWGDVGCFSAHPLKNLNACGDAGFLVTDKKSIYTKTLSLRNHGLVSRDKVKKFAYLSRMDNLQAAILNFRLKNLQSVILQRRKNAKIYMKHLNPEYVKFPVSKKNKIDTFHTFVVQVNDRDKLKKFLQNKKIYTAIHYPVPIHLQPAAKYLRYKRGDFPNTEIQSKKILSLPINQFLKKKEILKISKEINRYYEN